MIISVRVCRVRVMLILVFVWFHSASSSLWFSTASLRLQIGSLSLKAWGNKQTRSQKELPGQLKPKKGILHQVEVLKKKTSSQAPSYASPKLWITHSPTGVKCRATRVAKNGLSWGFGPTGLTPLHTMSNPPTKSWHGWDTPPLPFWQYQDFDSAYFVNTSLNTI